MNKLEHSFTYIKKLKSLVFIFFFSIDIKLFLHKNSINLFKTVFKYQQA